MERAFIVVETAKQGSGRTQAKDCRINQVAGELRRYKVSVAALQETRWYGSNVY